MLPPACVPPCRRSITEEDTSSTAPNIIAFIAPALQVPAVGVRTRRGSHGSRSHSRCSRSCCRLIPLHYDVIDFALLFEALVDAARLVTELRCCTAVIHDYRMHLKTTPNAETEKVKRWKEGRHHETVRYRRHRED